MHWTKSTVRWVMVGLGCAAVVGCGPGAPAEETETAAPTETASGNPSDIWTPAARGETETVIARVKGGVAVDSLDPNFGATAITFAGDFGHAETVRALLDAGADVDARNQDGSTPLIGAAFFGRADCVRALLDAGADASITNNDGSTAMSALEAPFELTAMIAGALQMPLDPEALQAGRDECREILREHGDG